MPNAVSPSTIIHLHASTHSWNRVHRTTPLIRLQFEVQCVRHEPERHAMPRTVGLGGLVRCAQENRPRAVYLVPPKHHPRRATAMQRVRGMVLVRMHAHHRMRTGLEKMNQ